MVGGFGGFGGAPAWRRSSPTIKLWGWIEAFGRTPALPKKKKKLNATPLPPPPPLGSRHVFPAALALAAGRPSPAGLQRGLGQQGEEGRWWGGGGGWREKESLVVFLLSPRFAPSDITAAPIPDARRPKVFFPGFIWLGRPFYKRRQWVLNLGVTEGGSAQNGASCSL